MRNRLTPILLAGALLASCDARAPDPGGEGSSTVSVEIPQAEPADPADAVMDGTGGPASNTTDRIVCRGADGRIVLDEFGTEMDPGNGRVTYTSTTSGLYMVQYGDCTMIADAPRPADWKAIIPGYADPASAFAGRSAASADAESPGTDEPSPKG